MKRLFHISHDDAKQICIEFIQSLDADASVEVLVRKAHTTKTLQQLGTLFGLWKGYLSDKLGYSKDALHKEWKNNFLRHIYISNPVGDIQEMWVERLYDLQEQQAWDKLHKHAQRISLSWATLEQMKQYMNDIQHYYMEHGYPLPVPDSFYRWYK